VNDDDWQMSCKTRILLLELQKKLDAFAPHLIPQFYENVRLYLAIALATWPTLRRFFSDFFVFTSLMFSILTEVS